MKIAIVGDNPTAIDISYYFHQIGAATTTFYDQNRDPYFEHESWLKQRPEFYEILVPRIAGVTSIQKLNELKSQQIVKTAKVLRIQKQFLYPGEKVEGKSRLIDLFRVVYQENPDQVIEEQKVNNPEVFQTLSEDFLNSLKVQMEGYEDFDIVIDVSAINNFKKYLSNGCDAIGEKALRKNKQIFYGIDALHKIETECLYSSDNFNEYAIIGSDEVAALGLIELSPLLASKKIRVFIISQESEPFSKIMTKNNWLSEKVKNILDFQLDQLKSEQEIFQKKWHEWQDLEDYMKAKIPMPTEPIPNLVFFSAHNVVAVDKLIDKERCFLTCEVPSFRTSITQPENAKLALKTIGVDQIFALNGRESNDRKLAGIQIDKFSTQTITSEPGFYQVNIINQNLQNTIDEIFKNIQKYFEEK